jgi:hypothetical protein
MYQDLQSYKARENANQEYAEKIERRIQIVASFLQCADAAIIEAEEEREEAYNKGFKAAEKARTDAPFDRLNPTQREDYRAWTIHQAQNQFPHLY